jgi:hypothetical protein
MSDRIRELLKQHDSAYRALKSLPQFTPPGVRGDLSDREDIARSRAATALGLNEHEYMEGREIGVWRNKPTDSSGPSNARLLPVEKLPLRPLGAKPTAPRNRDDRST